MAHSALLTTQMQDSTEWLPWQPFLTHFLFRSPSRNSVIKHSHPRCRADARPVFELAALSCLPGLGHVWPWWSMWVAGGKPKGCGRPIRVCSLFFPTPYPEGPSLHPPRGSVPSHFLAKPPGHLTTIHCVPQRRPLRRVWPGVCTETMCKVGRQSWQKGGGRRPHVPLGAHVWARTHTHSKYGQAPLHKALLYAPEELLWSDPMPACEQSLV